MSLSKLNYIALKMFYLIIVLQIFCIVSLNVCIYTWARLIDPTFVIKRVRIKIFVGRNNGFMFYEKIHRPSRRNTKPADLKDIRKNIIIPDISNITRIKVSTNMDTCPSVGLSDILNLTEDRWQSIHTYVWMSETGTQDNIKSRLSVFRFLYEMKSHI